MECEQIVWVDDPSGPGPRWSRYLWRRGTVPIHWGVELKNQGFGEAELYIKENPYVGTDRYFTRMVEHYREEAAGAAVDSMPVFCVNLLRFAPGKSEQLLAEHFQQVQCSNFMESFLKLMLFERESNCIRACLRSIRHRAIFNYAH